MRIGHGFDLHKYLPGEFITLAGLKIPCEFQLEAHSDGDVVYHAICDAILGALALGDIGEYFPPSDPKWKDVPSINFINEIKAKLDASPYKLANLDVTILAQAPKIGPHKATMRSNIATALDLEPTQVNIKATTMEGLGPIGTKQAIAAEVVVLLIS